MLQYDMYFDLILKFTKGGTLEENKFFRSVNSLHFDIFKDPTTFGSTLSIKKKKKIENISTLTVATLFTLKIRTSRR